MRWPTRTAVVSGGLRQTYTDLLASVQALAAGLAELGVRPGDRVACLAPNRAEFVWTYFAAMWLGAAFVPMSIAYRSLEIEHVLKHSEAKALVMTAAWGGFSFIDAVSRLRAEGAGPAYLIALEPGVPDTAWIGELVPAAGRNAAVAQASAPAAEADDLAAIVYTSGTTGSPKGVMHTHNTILRGALASNQARGVGPDDVWLSLIPLSSAFGVLYILPCPLISGGALVLMDQFQPGEAVRLIERERVTSPVGVPTMFIRMLNAPEMREADVSCVRNVYLGGAAAPVEMMRRIVDRFGCTVTMTYGASEFGHATITALDDPLEVVCQTSGRPMYGGIEVKVTGPDGRALPVGAVGEIRVRGYADAIGYFRDEGRTRAAFDDRGWACVGDLGRIDEEGRLTVVGRKSHVIVRGGQNIYPDEIESLIYQHPHVAEVAVVGYPDPELGERTCACVIPAAGTPGVTRDDLVAFFAGRLARYKIPDRLLIVDQLPLTASGKVRKYALAEWVAGQIGLPAGGA